MRIERFERNGITSTLYLGDCFELAAELPAYSCVITDPPFSERTHKGHDVVANGKAGEGNDFANRKGLGYAAWGEAEVRKFCAAFNPNGWLVVMTDHILARDFETAMRYHGRYVFAPLPSYTPGRSVRLSGDGPSSWTDWIIVSRTAKQSKWGTLPGGYVNTAINRAPGGTTQMGGKSVALMAKIIRDYSREGDTVCDPCCGSASTGLGCLMAGRHFIGIEKDEANFENSCRRIEREASQAVMF